MIHDTADAALFPRLGEDDMRRLAACCAEVRLRDGELLFSEREPPRDFFLVVEGQVRVSRWVGGEDALLAAHGRGEFTGDLSLVTGHRVSADARAVGDVLLLRIGAEQFPRVMADHPSVAAVVYRAVAGRAQELNAEMQRGARLEALGTLAAGLAHQLNNPGAAALRAAERVAGYLATLRTLSLELARHPLTDAQRTALAAAAEGAADADLTPLERSEREDELGDWLRERGIPSPWELVSPCVARGLEPRRLEALAEALPPDAAGAALRWLCVAAAADAAAAEARQATARIAELVSTVKVYTYMDRTPLQEVDVHEGLDAALALLRPRTGRGVWVERDYAAGLPRIWARGAELTEAWTRLAENALDALGARGHLRIRTRLEGERVRVEFADDGPGIPAELQKRVWEPFFTTKPPGDASGLGLDVVRRVVVQRHGGEVRLQSAPGDTRFEVWLPVRPAQRAGAPG